MPSWTLEQEKAINASGNLLVSAAAGAGKTAVMTERISRLIAGGVGAEELLVVTFTNAAAAEMKQRIERRLLELADECGTDENMRGASDARDMKRRLFDAAGDIARANISTIHSFCGNVLRRNYHEAGLDPTFRTSDAAEAALLRVSALDAVLEEAYAIVERSGAGKSFADGFYDEEPESLAFFNVPSFDAERFGTGFSQLTAIVGRDSELVTLITEVYNFIIARPDPLGWLHDAVEGYDGAFDLYAARAAELLMRSAKRSLRVFYAYADELYSACMDGSMENGDRFATMLFNDMTSVTAMLQLQSYDSWYYALMDYAFLPIPRVKGGAPQEIKEYRDELKKLIKRLQKAFCAPYEEERRTAQGLYGAMLALFETTRAFMDEYAARKRELALIDFNDMEQLTLRVLDNDEIASEYRQKFKFVFIDEYQDTNLVQESIISCISRGDNLFMVGDVKQSIYRFRQAEPDSFLEKYRMYDGKLGTRIDLNANFRSMTAVLSAANDLFSKLMLGDVGEIDYSDNAALRPGADAKNGSAEIVLIDIGGRDEAEIDAPEDASVLEAAEAEAANAAETIKQLMQEAVVFDKSLGRERSLVFSDFAVLLRRTRGVALQWTNTLSALGVPCTAELGDGYFEAVEVQVFMNLLRVIDNRKQDIPLMSVMNSPIGGFTTEELLHIRSDFEGEDLLSRLQAAAEYGERQSDAEGEPQNNAEGERHSDAEGKRQNNAEGKRHSNAEGELQNNAGVEIPTWCTRAERLLSNLKRWRRRGLLVGVDRLVGELLDETRYYIYVGAMRGGAVRQANLDLLSSRAHDYEKNGSRGLSGFIRLMDSIRDNLSMGAAQNAAVDAVRVMSVHKSKGLEFPVVFIGGIAGGFNKLSKRSPAVMDRSLGIGIGIRRGIRSDPLLRRAILTREDEKLIAEEMRILYVAMTRARERLFLLGASKRMEKQISDYASPLTNYRIMNAQCYLDWLLGAYFPLGLNVGSAKKGVFARVGNDELKLTYYDSVLHAVSSGRMPQEKFAAWVQSALAADCEAEKARLNFRYPNADDIKQPSKRSVTELVDTEYEYTPAVPLFLQQGVPLTGAQRGTATHRLIALLPIAPMTENEVRAELIRLTECGRITVAEADSVSIKAVMTLMKSGLYKRLLSSTTVRRELEFTLMIRDEDGNDSERHLDSLHMPVGTVLQGIIDCCFLEDDEWVVVDYKTTSVRDSDALSVAERYGTQLGMYAHALGRLTGKRVKESWVYVLSAGVAVRVQ